MRATACNKFNGITEQASTGLAVSKRCSAPCSGISVALIFLTTMLLEDLAMEKIGNRRREGKANA